ncbi:MAG: ABC transporter ATP-binding protein [Amylibacter sp.]|jgi:peptide/nickel transport system ATP-binding protein|tara:strand:+ start:3417 stop:4376 length:960 start_codon:yes stop_codon:yes gene_type:complete
MSENLLQIKNISVTFKTRHGVLKAIDDLSLNVKKGEILGLVGESGAGKSMTGAAVLGLIDPPGRLSSGQIWYKGQRIDQAPETIRGHEISMIFQDPLVSLNPLRRIGDQLVETILTHMPITKAEAVDRARKGLEEVGIDPERINAYPHTFSGGMRQRVVIALALAPEPALIIADEPTTALDVSVQAQILDLLKQLCRERGTSIILVTHDMGVIAETTDRVGVLYAGRLAEIGETRDVLTNPKHPYTKGLVASTPRIDASSFDKTLYQISGSMPKLDAMPNGCAFHPRCEFALDKCRIDRPSIIADRAACWLLDGEETLL